MMKKSGFVYKELEEEQRLDFLYKFFYNVSVNNHKAMTLTSKFKKDISTLRAAANKEIYLDVKNPKLYKKVTRYYVSEGIVELSGEDPDADYSVIMECIAEDLAAEVA